ncbi:hypothetical protein SAMN05444406_103148 [Caldicoprobacter faecalis]|uniref:Uncharacterized protein n=2 Tax=Caldicoprobacter faecalis TaxID=937334 RepID=A0A1I5T2D6_9FIRM|nr:hypothetical protein SAMN05444406_103148 [Caldicoprobacter faecalis]
MGGMEEIKVRFIRFLEEVYEGDNKELKEIWVVTTSKDIRAETIWKNANSLLRKNLCWKLDAKFLIFAIKPLFFGE